MQFGLANSASRPRAGAFHDTAETNPALGASYCKQIDWDAGSGAIKEIFLQYVGEERFSWPVEVVLPSEYAATRKWELRSTTQGAEKH